MRKGVERAALQERAELADQPDELATARRVEDYFVGTFIAAAWVEIKLPLYGIALEGKDQLHCVDDGSSQYNGCTAGGAGTITD